MAATLVAATAVAATPAHAGRVAIDMPHWYPACSRNVRVNPTTNIYDNSGAYYGWAEQRYSSNGSCNGEQWVLLHVTRTIYTGYYGLSITESLPNGNWVGLAFGTGNDVVYPGTYECPMLRAYSAKMTAWIVEPNYMYFGYNGRPAPWIA
jgi:hypothetical protein